MQDTNTSKEDKSRILLKICDKTYATAVNTLPMWLNRRPGHCERMPYTEDFLFSAGDQSPSSSAFSIWATPHSCIHDVTMMCSPGKSKTNTTGGRRRARSRLKPHGMYEWVYHCFPVPSEWKIFRCCEKRPVSHVMQSPERKKIEKQSAMYVVCYGYTRFCSQHTNATLIWMENRRRALSTTPAAGASNNNKLKMWFRTDIVIFFLLSSLLWNSLQIVYIIKKC